MPDFSQGIDQYVEEYQVRQWQDAAQKLNVLYGEERYVCTRQPESKQGEGVRKYRTLHRVTVTGPWQEDGKVPYEFMRAEGVASRVKGTIDTLPHLSRRLAVLELDT